MGVCRGRDLRRHACAFAAKEKRVVRTVVEFGIGVRGFGGGEDQPAGALLTTPVTYAATAIAPTAATASTDAAFAAHIERIAAAIAEVAAGGAKADVHLTLPTGATRIDGAVIGRDAMGQLHIVLTTASAIAPATAAQLQSQLTERLLRRDIRVSKMGLQRINRGGSEA